MNKPPKMISTKDSGSFNDQLNSIDVLCKKLNSYEESVETTSPITDKTYKQADNKVLTVTQTYYTISINETNYGEAYKVLKNSTAYWVASRSVNTYSGGTARFGLRVAGTGISGYNIFYSDGSTDRYNCRLRPVVSLPSSILSDTKDAASGAWNLTK